MRLDELGDSPLDVDGDRRGHGRESTTSLSRWSSCRSSAANVARGDFRRLAHRAESWRANRLAMRDLAGQGVPRRPRSFASARAVTPEVAGSSPVAPAKVPPNLGLLLPGLAQSTAGLQTDLALIPLAGYQVRLRFGKGLEIGIFLLLVQAPTTCRRSGPSCADPARETGGQRPGSYGAARGCVRRGDR